MSKLPMNSDTVFVRGLALDASIGVFEWEKKIKQRLLFDLDLSGDFSVSSQTDNIDDAVNYAQVCQEIETLLSVQHYQLLEFLAERICEQLFKCFNISTINLSIYKPEAVPKASSVGVSVFRQRKTDLHSE